MLNLHIKAVPEDKVPAFMEIADKQVDHYHGYFRQFITPDFKVHSIDSRDDDDLIRIGLLEADADTNHSIKED